MIERCNIKSLLKTVALVTIFSCVERFAGFLYRIFLSRTLGGELIGIYQVTLSIVGVLVTLTASGIPITVSRLMMKEKALGSIRGQKDVVSAGIFSSILLSLPITLILYFFRSNLCFIFADQRCYDLLLVMLPGVILTSVYAVIRGYFWGNQNFFTYSLIELIEELVMCFSGVIIILLSKSAWQKTLGAAQSVLISYIFSFVVSTILFVAKSGRLTNPLNKLKPLVVAASPITAMRTLTSLLGSVIAIILPSKLIQSGMGQSLAMQSFGELTGMTMPLLFIPSTLIGSIALVVVPKLSESFYKNDKETLCSAINRTVDYSLLICIFIVPVFIVCGNEIGLFVYKNQNAGHYLSVASFIMVPMSLSMISTSVLNSLNKERLTLLNFIIGSLLMILSIVFLTKKVGIYSLIIGYFLSYIATALLNFITLSKITKQGKKYLKKLNLYLAGICLCTAFGYLFHGIMALRVEIIYNLVLTGLLCIMVAFIFVPLCGLFDYRSIFK